MNFHSHPVFDGAPRVRLTARGRLLSRVVALAVTSLLLAACGMRVDRSKNGARGPTPSSGSSGFGGRGASAAIAACALPPSESGTALASSGKVRVAVIGDYGRAGTNEANVAALVRGWSPDAVITTGDNNYPAGGADTIDANIGQYYHQFIGPYLGGYGCGSTENRFFPSLGNHDLNTDSGRPYRDYFALPGNERYYDVALGSVHLFALASDPSEPDGITSAGVQAAWLKQRLGSSTARWKVVYTHHPPYSSGPHQSSEEMRWPFKEWGADLVLAGHDHDYERLEIGGLAYVVDGLGGASLYTLGAPIAGSKARFDSDFGAVLMNVQPTMLSLQFFSVAGAMIDQLVLNKP